MAKIHGIPGEWARVKGTVLGLWPLFLGVFVAGASLAGFLLSPLWGAVLFVAALLYIIWSLMRGLRRVERFYKGARGSWPLVPKRKINKFRGTINVHQHSTAADLHYLCCR